MPKRTRGYNSWRLEKLADPEIAAGYLNDAKQDSPEMFLKALLNVTQDRKKAGVQRESIYRAFSEEGNPTLGTLDSVLNALGFKIEIVPKAEKFVEPPASTPRHKRLATRKIQRKPISRRIKSTPK
jgi:probable addiction module antidote protein